VKIFKLAAGVAVGYVLGSRAGRDKYEQIVAAARKAQSHPAVTQAQQKAKEFLGTATDTPAATPDPEPAVVIPATVTAADPVPRPPRRQPKSPLTGAATVTEPLA
jgi:hypothetical protein